MFVSERIIMLLVLLLLIASIPTIYSEKHPHIIFVLADDFGWNDVGFHGSGYIPTPNIDALAYSGVILDRYYVAPICTPSRSALMTGKYPIHTGMQHGVLKNPERRGLPLHEKLLPQYLQELGYETHMVGKWHLGLYKKVYTPTYRGFKSHLGFWGGRIDYFDHTSVEFNFWGLDMRRGMQPAWDLHGRYLTDILTSESVKLIENHDVNKPLFLYIAHGATHSANEYDPLQVNVTDMPSLDKCGSYHRNRFAGMTYKLDQSVGSIVKALNKKDMLQDSIIVFSTDNGGPANGFNFNYASNWPLRGVKNTLYEGGVRGVGLVWSPRITRKGRIAKQLFHITDWLPTLITAAGGNNSNLNIDGIDMWNMIKNDSESARSVILHNIDDKLGTSAITVGEWKLLQGSTYGQDWNDWYGPSERNIEYNISKIVEGDLAKIFLKIGMEFSENDIKVLRKNMMIDCPERNDTLPLCAPEKSPCLINIFKDPCEQNNFAHVHLNIFHKLLRELAKYNATAIPPNNVPFDERANPDNWGHVWTNFGDIIKD